LETLLSLVLKLIEQGLLTLSQALARVTINPVRILGIDAGKLEPGAPSDICIFDPTAT